MPTGKTVDIHNPLDPTKVIHPCCERARGAPTEALPTIRAVGDGVEIGYVLDTAACDCLSRWLKHDWRRYGHATFPQAKKRQSNP